MIMNILNNTNSKNTTRKMKGSSKILTDMFHLWVTVGFTALTVISLLRLV